MSFNFKERCSFKLASGLDEHLLKVYSSTETISYGNKCKVEQLEE